MNKLSALCWLTIALPICALFGPALASDRSFAFRDAGHFYYPLFEWCCREWGAGRVPLWNPYEQAGMPALADATSSVFYPGKLLFLVPVSFALRYKLYIVIHVVLAAAGSYGLARAWRSSLPAAALAAITYACGGNVVFQYCNVPFLVGAAWLPVAVLALDGLVRRRSGAMAMLLALTLTLMILGGDPQAAVHAVLISALYAVVWSRARRSEAVATDGVAEGDSRGLVGSLVLVGIATAGAFALAAIQILPSAEALRYSQRAAFDRPRNVYEAAGVALSRSEAFKTADESAGQAILRGLFGEPSEHSHQEATYDFSVGPWRLMEYFWPNISGRMFPRHQRWPSLLPAEQRTWNPSLYMGLLPAVLALSCLSFWRSTARQRWLSLLVLGFTLGSFGFYGGGWLVHEICAVAQWKDSLPIGSPVGGVYWLFATLVPTYAYFRYPAKLLPVVSLGLSQLAAMGLDRATENRRPGLERALLFFGGGSGVAGLALVCGGFEFWKGPGQRAIVWMSSGVQNFKIDWSDGTFGPFAARGADSDILLALLQTACVAGIAVWLLRKATKQPENRPGWKLILVALTAAEISIANRWLIATAPLEIWRDESPVANCLSLEEKADVPPRVYRGNLASWRPQRFTIEGSAKRIEELAQWERDTLFPKYHLASEIGLVESYGPIELADQESLLRVAKQHGPRQPDKSYLPQPTALRLLGTQYLVLPDVQRPAFAERLDAAVSEDGIVWRMERTLPRAWIVHDVEVLPELRKGARLSEIDERTREVLFPDGLARDFAQTAVIESYHPLLTLSKRERAATVERCELTRYEPQRVVIGVELTRPGLVVLSDAWYPGWKATITSEDKSQNVPVLRTNRICRSVYLPTGSHTIEYRFVSETFWRGAWISGCSWLILGGIVVAQFGRPRRLRTGKS